MSQPFDSTAFRQVMGRFATGIAVVTARNAALGRFGLTINSLTSVSLDPPLILFCLDRAAHLHDAFEQTELLTINLLGAGQEAVSRHFATRSAGDERTIVWQGEEDRPRLADTLGWLQCRPKARHPGGDHTIFVCRITDLHAAEAAAPLLYYRGAYRRLAD